MSERQQQNTQSVLLKTNTETLSFLTKENIITKHERSIRLSYIDLSPYLSQHFGFIDPDFPHVQSSLKPSQQPPVTDIQWLPAEQLLENVNYSDQITSLQGSIVGRKSMGLALTLVNWFAGQIFADIFLQQISKCRLYSFDVMIDGVFISMPIDSYIPVYANTKKQLFASNFKGSIFPCLYQKLLAKIYGDYESITAQFLDIVQLQTLFCRQQVNLTKGMTTQNCRTLITRKLNQNSIVSFRTRNSIRLQSLGLQSNHVYIILRLIDHQGVLLVQFLELQGQAWIGKYSKLRSDWLLQESFIERKQIIRNQQFKQNYMSIRDMQGIARELVILNNTQQFHKNYVICQNNTNYLNLYNFQLKQTNRVMFRLNFKHKKCYSTIIIVKKSFDRNYKLIGSNFHQNKDNNYYQNILQAGEYGLIVYSMHPQQEILTYNITVFSSTSFLQLIQQMNSVDIYQTLEIAFRNYFSEQFQLSEDIIFFRQMYARTGLSFIFIKSQQYPIQVNVNLKLMEQNRIYALNLISKRQKQEFSARIFESNSCGILIFRCLWSKKENIVFNYENINSHEQIQKILFPPLQSVKIFKKKQKSKDTYLF